MGSKLTFAWKMNKDPGLKTAKSVFSRFPATQTAPPSSVEGIENLKSLED